MHEIICITCNKKVTVKYTHKYCLECRPPHLQRQLQYYYRRQRANQKYKCPDCGKGVSQKGRRCIICARFHCRPEWQQDIGPNRRYVEDGRRPGAYYIHIKIEGKWIPEHRYIWEQTYNQKIPPTYQIHHLDGNKLNNSPSNLYALSRSDHHSHKFILILQGRIKGLQKELAELKKANHLL